MFKKIALSLGAALALFLVFVALKPADYIISRETTINAPAEKIFPYLNNSKLASQWGPWLEIDPQARMNINGPEAGVGSRTSWAGGKQLGTGSATIVESVPNQKVGIVLEYVEPMKMVQYSEYLVRASGGQSVVTWQVAGKNNFMGRMMCTFVNIDKMVGSMFEKGLLNLKTLVEKQ